MSTQELQRTRGTTSLPAKTEGTMLLIEDQSVEQRWENVRRYVGNATKFAQAFLACQVMAGMELLELKKVKGITQGARTDRNFPNDLGSWAEMVQKCAGISDETARNWMKMAEGLKPRLKKLPGSARLRELLELPPSAWSVDDSEMVFQAVQKSTEGKTQTDFLIELGYAKKPQGSGATGREKGSEGNPGKKLSLAEQHNELLRIAHEDWVETRKLLTGYREKFVVLTDDEVTAQIATLEQALNARKAWLKQPANQRDIPAIAVMFKKTV